jgi:hypothetical protein
LMSVLEANLALKNRVKDLQRSEEAKIVAEYQQIFDLHRDTHVDTELEEDLSKFQENIEQFEAKLQKDEIRLEELARIRDEARRLKPRLSSEEAVQLLDAPIPAESRSTEVRDPDALQTIEVRPSEVIESSLASASEMSEKTRKVYNRLLASLEDTDMQTRPRSVTLTPEVFPFKLEPREVMAFRRLVSPSPCDRELERFVFESASIRVLMDEEIAELAGILDDTAVTRDAPVFEIAADTCRQAGLQIKRFDHLIEIAVLARDADTAADLQMLRMRMMREYSELWLLASKPT